jgi:hypothetical protein
MRRALPGREFGLWEGCSHRVRSISSWCSQSCCSRFTACCASVMRLARSRSMLSRFMPTVCNKVQPPALQTPIELRMTASQHHATGVARTSSAAMRRLSRSCVSVSIRLSRPSISVASETSCLCSLRTARVASSTREEETRRVALAGGFRRMRREKEAARTSAKLKVLPRGG